MDLFDGFDQIIDDFLGLDSTWAGTFPRYKHKTTLNKLCQVNQFNLKCSGLLDSLYNRLTENWKQSTDLPVNNPSGENWRFEKQTRLGEDATSAEVILERTIARVTDHNWANQIPTVSGVIGAGSNALDLCHREGTEFSFIELKVDANTPLSAAFQIIRYGIAYTFSRVQSEALEYQVKKKEILRASSLHLRVLAPSGYYPLECEWLQDFQEGLNNAVKQFGEKQSGFEIPMSFRFEAFPESWEWHPDRAKEESTQKELLWALHRRCSPFLNFAKIYFAVPSFSGDDNVSTKAR